MADLEQRVQDLEVESRRHAKRFWGLAVGAGGIALVCTTAGVFGLLGFLDV